MKIKNIEIFPPREKKQFYYTSYQKFIKDNDWMTYIRFHKTLEGAKTFIKELKENNKLIIE